MTKVQVMSELKKMGTEQNRKIYTRHGASEPMFGVSFASLTKLKKKLKGEHGLGMRLWSTGNMDAMTLGLMIIDPEQLKREDAERMLKGLKYYLLVGMLAGVVSRSSSADQLMKKWMGMRKEYVRQAGYDILAGRLSAGEVFKQKELKRFIETIESEIQDSPNRARHAMNMALIAIGLYIPELEKDVLAAAKRIGRVEVDHGETGCKTPEVVAYIKKGKIRARKRFNR